MMKTYQVRYTRIPTNFHDSQNAVIEAETPEDARALLQRKLGEGNGVHNYVIDAPVEHDPPPIAGRIVSLALVVLAAALGTVACSSSLPSPRVPMVVNFACRSDLRAVKTVTVQALDDADARYQARPFAERACGLMATDYALGSVSTTITAEKDGDDLAKGDVR